MNTKRKAPRRLVSLGVHRRSGRRAGGIAGKDSLLHRQRPASSGSDTGTFGALSAIGRAWSTTSWVICSKSRYLRLCWRARCCRAIRSISSARRRARRQRFGKAAGQLRQVLAHLLYQSGEDAHRVPQAVGSRPDNGCWFAPPWCRPAAWRRPFYTPHRCPRRDSSPEGALSKRFEKSRRDAMQCVRCKA